MNKGVLFITGAFYPEISGGGLQLYNLAQALRRNFRIYVITTTRDKALPFFQEINRIPIWRVYLKPGRLFSYLKAGLIMTYLFLKIRARINIIQLNGFSKKNIVLVLLAKLTRVKIVQRITSFGMDDPVSMKAASSMIDYYFYKISDFFVSISPAITESFYRSGINEKQLKEIPNGVDTERFSPLSVAEKLNLRQELSLPLDDFIVLSVGFFSRDKSPDDIYRAWAELMRDSSCKSTLIFIGSTDTGYSEIDAGLVLAIKDNLMKSGLNQKVWFVEKTLSIEKYYQAADVFVTASRREGMPNALLEAMASGLPVLSSRLPGIIDFVINDGKNGLLFNPGKVDEISNHLNRIKQESDLRVSLGSFAREKMINKFSLNQAANAFGQLYKTL